MQWERWGHGKSIGLQIVKWCMAGIRNMVQMERQWLCYRYLLLQLEQTEIHTGFPLDIGIWCQCSQKYRWCFNTHNSLNSHHLDPKETACLDSLISDRVLLHGWQLEVTFLHFCFVLFCYFLIILTFLFSFSELLLLTLSLIALSALNWLGHLIPRNSTLPFITCEQIWRWGVCVAPIHAHKSFGSINNQKKHLAWAVMLFMLYDLRGRHLFCEQQ